MTARVAWARAGLVLALVVAADQATKALVIASLERGERRDVVPLVDLVNVRNTGVAFGALDGAEVLVGVIIGVTLIALLAYFATHARQPALWLPVGLLAGGAVGNLIDRVRIGAVIDFVKLPSWPAFNLADMAITLGVVTLLVVLELAARREKRAERGGAPGSA